MRFEESFTVQYPARGVWAFFEDVHRLARCVPVVRTSSRSRTGAHASRMHVAAQEPGEYVEVVSIGRSVKGAVGELRSVNRVEVAPEGETATKVKLGTDVALGGVLGSVGTKAMAIKAKQVAKEFATTFARQIELFRKRRQQASA